MQTMLLYMSFIICMLSNCVLSGDLNDSTTLVNNLLRNYNKNVRPINDHNAKTNVSVFTYLKSIQEFDEVREVFAYTGAFMILWHDAGMVWDPTLYGGVDRVKISYRKVWVPDLVLTTPSDEMDTFGKPWQLIEYSYTGAASWLPGGLMKSTCSVDVAKYPFDKQTCKSDFNVWSYDIRDVMLYSLSDKVESSLFAGNVAWDLVDSSVRVVTLDTWSQLEVTFYLRRKSTFIVVNILMPILFLSLINVLVFLLVPESGERVSYCITVLLSIAVFMTIISDTLPRSSEPLPKISYKLMKDMIISSLITFVTILNLRFYYKSDEIPVPNWLKTVYTIVYRPKSCNIDKSSQKVHPKVDDVIMLTDINERDFLDKSGIDHLGPIKKKPDSVTPRLEKLITDEKIATQMTWKDISKLVDFVSIIVFTLLSVLSFGVFILYVSLS